jgi:hypothetical protein
VNETISFAFEHTVYVKFACRGTDDWPKLQITGDMEDSVTLFPVLPHSRVIDQFTDGSWSVVVDFKAGEKPCSQQIKISRYDSVREKRESESFPGGEEGKFFTLEEGATFDAKLKDAIYARLRCGNGQTQLAIRSPTAEPGPIDAESVVAAPPQGSEGVAGREPPQISSPPTAALSSPSEAPAELGNAVQQLGAADQETSASPPEPVAGVHVGRVGQSDGRARAEALRAALAATKRNLEGPQPAEVEDLPPDQTPDLESGSR